MINGYGRGSGWLMRAVIGAAIAGESIWSQPGVSDFVRTSRTSTKRPEKETKNQRYQRIRREVRNGQRG